MTGRRIAIIAGARGLADRVAASLGEEKLTGEPLRPYRPEEPPKQVDPYAEQRSRAKDWKQRERQRPRRR